MAWDDDFEEEATELDVSPEPPAELPKGAITITLQLDKYLSSGTLESLIADNIARQISGDIKKVIQQQVEATILKQAKGEFAKHAKRLCADFFEKEFFEHDRWGGKTGKKTSVVEHFGELFKQYMDQKVSPKNGEESGYSDGIKRNEYIFRSMAIAPLNQAIQQKVGEVAAEAKKQIQDSVSRYIADQLTPTLPAVPQLKA
jgi:histone H3/H4